MQKFQEFVKGINEYVTALNTIAKEYDNAEDRNVQVAKS